MAHLDYLPLYWLRGHGTAHVLWERRVSANRDHGRFVYTQTITQHSHIDRHTQHDPLFGGLGFCFEPEIITFYKQGQCVIYIQWGAFID